MFYFDICFLFIFYIFVYNSRYFFNNKKIININTITFFKNNINNINKKKKITLYSI